MLRAWQPSTGSLPRPMLDEIQPDRDRDPIKEQQRSAQARWRCLLYLLDANVLIDAHRDYYPLGRVPEFWDGLSLPRKPTLPSNLRSRCYVTLFGLTALLLAIGAPQVHAQNPTDDWADNGGTVEVSETTLRIREGESATYRVRLTKPLPFDENGMRVGGWWVMAQVDGDAH